jgi:glycosyltransferase involved in cell wall biosynthesis
MEKITIVIPVFCEEKNIELLYEKLNNITNKIPNYQWEYIFINDGSTDRSYEIMEILASKHSIFDGMDNLKRAKLAQRDWAELCEDLTTTIFNIRPSTLKYLQYLDSIKDDPKKLLAHVYVRHMGDMFGGQQLAKLTPGNGHMYKFEDIPSLISAVRSKLDVSLADEAIVAFKHNIEMVKEYND